MFIILVSSVKFIAGPAFASFDQKYEFTFYETVLYSVTGGMLGVFVFTFFTRQITRLWHWLKTIIRKVFYKDPVFSEPTVDVDGKVEVHYSYVRKNEKQRKVFTKRNRRLVKIWKKYGLIGIAFLTPVIISIPLGTIVANNMVENKKKIFLYMFISIVFWSLLLTFLYEIYHVGFNLV